MLLINIIKLAVKLKNFRLINTHDDFLHPLLEKLLSAPLPDGGQLPSPNMLRNKIIIKVSTIRNF